MATLAMNQHPLHDNAYVKLHHAVGRHVKIYNIGWDAYGHPEYKYRLHAMLIT